MRYLIVFFLALLLLVPSHSFALEGDDSLISGTPIRLGSLTSTTLITEITDGNLDTFYRLPLESKLYIKFDYPVDVTHYRLKASVSAINYGVKVVTGHSDTCCSTAYKGDWQKAEQFAGYPGYQKDLTYVVIANWTGKPVDIYELELYAPPPPVPSNVSITSYSAFHDRIMLSFSGTNAKSFDIYKDDQFVGTAVYPTNSYVVSGLQPITSYRFHVVGKNVSGSVSSSVITAKTKEMPPPPTFSSFRVTDVLDKSVRLSFSFLNADRYEVYRNGSLIGELPANSNTYIAKTDPSTDYKFWVVAINDYGRTASNIIDLKTQEELVPPSEPILSVAGVYTDRVDMNVSVKRAKTIKFYRDNRLVNTIAGDVKTYTDNTVDANKEYVYKFVADNEVGSVASDELKVKTLKPPVTDVPIIYISPNSKTFLDSLTFMLSSNDPDASLFYSFDGSDWLPYSSPVKISKTSDVYAKAVNVLGVESSVIVNRYVHRENPKVQLGVDLQDVLDAGGSHFNFLWPVVAFAAGLIMALLYSKKFRDLF